RGVAPVLGRRRAPRDGGQAGPAGARRGAGPDLHPPGADRGAPAPARPAAPAAPGGPPLPGERGVAPAGVGAADGGRADVRRARSRRPGGRAGPGGPGGVAGAGAAPRAAFILRLPFRREVPEPRALRVRAPLVAQVVGSAPLWGQVLGPGGIPLAGAAVEVPALELFTSADADGRFRFASVPADPPPKVVVRAKGTAQTFAGPDVPGAPLTLQFQIEEG